MTKTRIAVGVVVALLAAPAAPVAAQDDDSYLDALTPAYTQGPFFVYANADSDDCGPNEAGMERIIEGELLRAGLETGPNEHRVFISASTLGFEFTARACAVVVRTEMRADALSPDGTEVRADLWQSSRLLTGSRSDMRQRVRDAIREHAADIATDILRTRQRHRLAAEQGDAGAQYNLGVRYADGLGGPQDDREAVRWFRLAAEQGRAGAQNDLGFMYDTGRGVPQDDREAVRWYRLAAEQGFARAQRNLGRMYAEGRGVAQDAREALRWYRLAAAQGHAGAQTTLGVMYAAGFGVPQDDREAVRLYRLAADQGDAGGQFWLGGMYAEGRGVAQDAREAVRWYRLAAEQGHAEAQAALERLEEAR